MILNEVRIRGSPPINGTLLRCFYSNVVRCSQMFSDILHVFSDVLRMFSACSEDVLMIFWGYYLWVWRAFWDF